jgi:hypothetical protein
MSTALGYLPGTYVGLINTWCVHTGVYGEDTARLVDLAVDQALVWRTHVGFRPFAHLGLYLDAGYTMVTLGGGLTAGQVVSAETGVELPPGPPLPVPPGVHAVNPATDSFTIGSTLHLVDLEVGWELLVLRSLYLRTAVGGVLAVAASARVAPQFTPLSPQAMNAFVSAAGERITSSLESVRAPVVSVSLGYAWF